MTQTADPDTTTADSPPSPDRESWLRRNQTWIKRVSMAVVVVGILIFLRGLPVDQAVEKLKGVIAGYGPWGYVVFGAIYVVAAVLLIPGSALTVAAGAIFGLGWGFVTVAISATVAAAVAFLIARYLARSRVERMAKDSKKFGAVDKAIEEGGWKVVAMLRLSPVIPYSAANYLFGLTPVPFWRYVLASFFAMMPGTLLYVYIGTLATAAAGGGKKGGVWTYVFYGVGLLATVAVTVYLTHLARKKLKEQTDVEKKSDESEKDMNHKPVGWVIWALPLAALLVLVAVPFRGCASKQVSGLFGPPVVTPEEAYAKDEGSATFDHSAFDALLKAHVDDEGFVDYPGLKDDRGKLDAYAKTIADAPFDDLGRDEKLALLLNAYNAFTLQLILDHYPVKSIKDIDKPWDQRDFTFAGEKVTLNEMEHRRIRPKFAEPRVHFALVCAAFSCPKLRNEAYTGDKLDAQLQDQSDYSMTHPRWLQLDGESLKLTSIMDWYGGDFDKTVGSPLKFAAEHNEKVKKLVDAGKKPGVGFLNYDWSLNSQANRNLLDAFKGK